MYTYCKQRTAPLGIDPQGEYPYLTICFIWTLMRTIVLSTDQYTSGANVTRINMVTISGPAVPHHPTHHITRATHLIGRMDPDHTSQLHPHKSISIKEIQNREAICPPQVTLILKVVTPLTEAATTRIILQEKIIMSVTIQTIKQ